MKKLTASAILAAAATAFGVMLLAADASAHEDDESGRMMGPGYGHGPTMGPGYGYGHGTMMGLDCGYGHEPMMGHGQMPMYGFRYHIPMIDQNDDGIVSQDEAAARHERMFQLLDGDDDGALNEEEFVYAPMGRRPGVALDEPRWQRRHQHRHQRFEALDGDGDDGISKAEFMTAGAERFAGADLDDDGKVTVWEFRSRRRK